ncbi:MAG: hypothetical protein F4087_07630 [Gemmatimonadetes bacterium]|nr:hypothetical protein [Gemmatimonadota bacterium]
MRPLRRLAGGCAPSDPGVSGPPREPTGGEVLQPPNPVAGATAERSPIVADDSTDLILDGRSAGNWP